MGLTGANANTLMIDYERSIVETIADEARTHKMFQDRPWQGDFVEFSLHSERNSGMGFGLAGSEYRPAGRQAHEKGRIYRKFYDASIQLDDLIMAAARTTKNAAKAAVDQEVSGLERDALKFHNVFAFLDGGGDVATVMGTTTVSGQQALRVSSSVGLWEGGLYDVYDSSGATNRGSVTIDFVQQDLSSGYPCVVVDEAALPAGTTATDLLVWRGSGNINALNRAFSGLQKLIDDSAVADFQGIDTRQNQRYLSVVLDNGGNARDVTPELFRQLDASIFQKMGKPAGRGKCVASPHQLAKLDEMEQDAVRYRPEDSTVGMSVKRVRTSNGVTEFEPDVDCPDSQMFRVDASQLYRYVQEELHFVRRGGQILFESTQSKNAVAHMREIAELAIHDRRSSGRIDDLSVDRVIGF